MKMRKGGKLSSLDMDLPRVQQSLAPTILIQPAEDRS